MKNIGENSATFSHMHRKYEIKYSRNGISRTTKLLEQNTPIATKKTTVVEIKITSSME